MQQNVHIVSKLPRIDIWNKQSQLKKEMRLARDDFRSVWDYCEY